VIVHSQVKLQMVNTETILLVLGLEFKCFLQIIDHRPRHQLLDVHIEVALVVLLHTKDIKTIVQRIFKIFHIIKWFNTKKK